MLARRLRLATTAAAVVLGVAFVSGTYVLTDTMRASFDDVFEQTVTGVDLVVRARGSDSGLGLVQTAPSLRERLPEGVLDDVDRVEGVATADGAVQGYAQFVGRDGDEIQSGRAPTLGLSWPASGEGPLELVDGKSRPPRAPGEVAMDAATAREHGFEVGDAVRVLLQGPAQEFTIVGLFGFGDTTDLGGVTFAAFDLATAQRVFDSEGALDAVYVTGDDTMSEAELRGALELSLGGSYDVVPAEVAAEETAAPVHQFLDLFNAALLGFAAVGLVVGGFIIFNTFAVLVAQRTRELGLLRAMGASPGQVLSSVVVEAAGIGVVAAGVGLAAGVGVAAALLGLVERVGFDVPDTPPVVLGRTVVVSILVGLVVTVCSALVPALRAARTPPAAAVHGPAGDALPPLRRRAVVGTVVGLAGVALLVAGLVGDPAGFVLRVGLVATGALTAFLGLVILVATIARPLSRVIGWPVARGLGVTGVLARANAMRNPRRTAATAAALVVGLGLVCLVAIFAASTKASLRTAVDEGIRADFVLGTSELLAFSPVVADRIAGLPAVEAVTGLRLAQVDVENDVEFVVAGDPAALPEVVDFDFVAGDADSLAGGGAGVLVHEAEADRYGLDLGDPVAMGFAGIGALDLTVTGVYARDNFLGGFPVPTFVVSDATYESSFGGAQQDSLVYVKAREGLVEDAREQIDDALADDFPNVEVQTRAEYRRHQEGEVDQFLAVLVALLLLSEVIAVLGIVNTLLLSVYERTRELGLLRVVGMSRRQVGRMIRGESVIVAVVGAVLGIVVGVLWGWAFTRALEEQGITEYVVPAGQVALFLALAVIAGFTAAVLPAWRAARLDVLEAITQE